MYSCILSPGGFGCQSRAPGEPGVDLDDAVLQRGGVEGVLDVALADNAKVTDHFNGRFTEHVVLLVG